MEVLADDYPNLALKIEGPPGKKLGARPKNMLQVTTRSHAGSVDVRYSLRKYVRHT
jgi:hypothetical protein